MATSTDTVAGVQMIALSEIRHDQNVRQEILAEEVDGLAQSIALLGQLTPVSVRPDNENGGYVLIAGHKRYAALPLLRYVLSLGSAEGSHVFRSGSRAAALVS